MIIKGKNLSDCLKYLYLDIQRLDVYYRCTRDEWKACLEYNDS